MACATVPLNFNAFLEKAKLKDDGSNYTDWVLNLRIILIAAQKNYVLEAPLGARPAAGATPDVMNVWQRKADDYSIHYRKQLFCRLPRRTAKARTADGKGLCRQPRTAKGSGKVGYGKQVLCRLLFMANGKESFAYSGGRQRGGTAKILDVRQR